MSSSSSSSQRYWLLKAEPDSRIVKGKDVKFSVDDFARIGTSPWEGVRNYEARNLMREMKVGEKALFYHSNCKNPGIAAFAEVAKEAYPDYTAWDASHPYYDPKSKESEPRWFMVDLKFSARAKNFIPLSLLRHIAECKEIPKEAGYIGNEGMVGIKNMDLVTRGRLSVQRVNEEAWNAIELMAEKGGWDEGDYMKGKKADTKGNKKAEKEKTEKATKTKAKKRTVNDDDGDDQEADEDDNEAQEEKKTTSTSMRKRKARDDDTHTDPPRRSTRSKK